MPNYVGGFGPFDSKVMLIGAYPGKEEDEQGIPMVGKNGQLTQELVEKAGFRWNEVYKTNVVKKMPPFGDVDKLSLIGESLQESTSKLWRDEIELIKPNVIIPFGDIALEAVTNVSGIMNWRGSIILAKDGLTKVVPTILPAALLPKGRLDPGLPWVYKTLIEHDVKRAYEESSSRSYNPPVRQLEIARNSLDVFRFFREYEKLSLAANDIESINCVPVCTGFAFNRYHALCIPLLSKIGNVQLTDMSRRELAECWKLVQEAFLRLKLIGQNYKYDEYKQSLIGFSGFNLVSDLLLKTHTIFPELPDKKLNTQASLWTRQPYYKDEGKEEKIGKQFNVDKFFKYNGLDCCVEFEIDEEQEANLKELSEAYHIPLRDFYYNYVMRKHKFYLKLENVGFKVDLERKAELKTKYEAMAGVVHEKLQKAIGHEVNVKSYPQVFELLYREMKFKELKIAPTSEDAIVSLLANHCKGPSGKAKAIILEDILEERRIRDQLSRQINFTPDYDNRCKTSVKITGTETARTSTNILKKPVRPKKIGLAFHTISKHGRLAKDIRSMFIPDDGKIFISVDASQAEARIVAVLAEDYELLKAFDRIDIHRRTAGLFFGFLQKLDLTPGDIGIVDHLEKDGPERFTGKMFRHAGNYDMKKGRAMNEFNVNAQKYEIYARISEWRAGQYLEMFHAASPRIRQIFHAGIIREVQTTRALINPFGRLRQFFGQMDDELFREGFAWIPQSTVADLVQSAALDIDDEFNGDTEVMWNAENHDALVISAPANNWEPYAKVMKKHMERVIDFSIYCSLKRNIKLVIPADVEISIDKEGNITNYAALRKVKVA